MNAEIRSLLLEDETRALNGTNRGIDHENIKHLQTIHQTVDRCLQSSECIEPVFQGELSLAVKSIPMYRFFDQAIRSIPDRESKKKWLERFAKRTGADLRDHGFRTNRELKFTKDGETTLLHLAMDPGILGDEEKGVIQSVIESIWQGDLSKFKIEWGSQNRVADLYKILFHPASAGERPFVRPAEKTMNLFPENRTRSIAHEFGHVLGFDDHYYTVWDPNRCEYIYETNDLDLMSNSASGDVTPEEWQTLLKLEEKPAS